MEWLMVQGWCTAFNMRFLDEINIAYYTIYIEQLACSPAKKQATWCIGKQDYPIEYHTIHFQHFSFSILLFYYIELKAVMTQ